MPYWTTSSLWKQSFINIGGDFLPTQEKLWGFTGAQKRARRVTWGLRRRSPASAGWLWSREQQKAWGWEQGGSSRSSIAATAGEAQQLEQPREPEETQRSRCWASGSAEGLLLPAEPPAPPAERGRSAALSTPVQPQWEERAALGAPCFLVSS